MNVRMKTLSGVLLLFNLPAGLAFFGFGCFALRVAWLSLEGRNEAPWYAAGFMGLVFVLIGVFLIRNALLTPGQMKVAAAPREEHPDEPWLWNPEWQSRQLTSSAHTSTPFLWAFALFWNTLTAVVFLVVWDQMVQELGREPKSFVVILFPLAGAVLLFAAVRNTLQARRFGTTVLHLDSLPIPVGGLFSGTLGMPGDVGQAEQIQARLTCFRISGSSKNRTSSPVWQDEQRLSRQALVHDGRAIRLPVSFPIPDSCEGTRSQGFAESAITWQLDVSATLPGVDYSASFILPVFRVQGFGTGENAEPTGFLKTIRPREEVRQSGLEPHERTVRMQLGPGGGSVWDFRHARAPYVAFGLTLFLAGWVGVSVWLVRDGAPSIFPIVFGLLGSLLAYAVFDLWFSRRVLNVRGGILTIHSGPVVLLRNRTVRAEDIADFGISAGMSAGTTAYHDIVVTLKDGKRVTLARYIRSLREAETICAELRETLAI